VNTPRFLLAAAAVFWGWQTGFWAIAVAAALVLEAPQLFARRFEVELARQKRIADLCVVLAAMVGTACFIAYGNPRAIVLLFQWLPIILLPLALLQGWGSASAIRYDVMFWGLRRDAAAGGRSVNLAYPYLVAWLVGSAAANQRGNAFSVGVVMLGAWALWGARRERSRSLLWAAEIVIAVAAGSLLHVGLNGAQVWLEGAAPEWMTGGGSRTDPYRASTDMGSIGDLKQSDEIVLRVKMAQRSGPALLLHRASYNEYGGAAWLARGARFTELTRAGPDRPWVLRPGEVVQSIEVAEQAIHGDPVLSLPAGAVTVEGDAISLKANPLGAVQAEAAAGFFIYRVGMGDLPAGMSVPTEADLRVPGRERVAIGQGLAEFGLAGMAPRDAVAALRRGFTARYAYSTRLAKVPEGRTPLAGFLLGSRAGHCEYFASASVLLLRAAGVPARYATGFSVQEYDAASGAYLVRERHAHAWARAWLDGAWIDIDTTPPGWARAEDLARPSGLRLRTWFTDAWSSLRYRYALWQRDSSEADKWRLFGGLGALVLAWLGWRVLGGRQAERKAGAAGPAAGQRLARVVAGDDSPFYAIEAALAQEGRTRNADESIGDWVVRLAREERQAPDELVRLASLHYRYRFDPAGLMAGEKEALARACAGWLERRLERGGAA
jgi:hypothetical protein